MAEGRRCWTSRSVYLLKCCVGEHQYVGTTGNSLHMRSQQYQVDPLRGKTSYDNPKTYLVCQPDWDRKSKPFTMEAKGKGAIKSNCER